MTLQTESQRYELASKLIEEAATILAEYWEVESAQQAKLQAAMEKYAAAKALMPLPLFPET